MTTLLTLSDQASARIAVVGPGGDQTLGARVWPVGLSIVGEMLRKYGLEDRVTLVAGDMFAGLPTGFGAHLYSNMFHDWDVESCHRLAKISFDTLAPGGRILLCEVPIDDTRDGPLFAACFTVAMLIRERGRQYSIPEFREMLTGAGFMNFGSQQIFGYYHLISAQKPLG